MTTQRTPIDWSDYGIYGEIDLTGDWLHVASYHEGGYEWSTFHAFWSPTERRYFWHGDSGCSCNGWGDHLRDMSDFNTGDKDALRRSFRQFAADHYTKAELAIDTAEQIARFNPRSLR